MTDTSAPWWAAVHQAANELTATLRAEVARAERAGTYIAPEKPSLIRRRNRRRNPGSLRSIAAVLRSEKLYTGAGKNKDIVGQTLNGDLSLLSNQHLVIAIARACRLIAESELDDDEARALAEASNQVRDLRARAKTEDARQAEEETARQRVLPVRRSPSTLAAPPRPIDTPGSGPNDRDTVVTGLVVSRQPDAITTRRPLTVRRRRGLAITVAVLVLLGGTAAAFAIIGWPDGSPKAAQPPSSAPATPTTAGNQAELGCRDGTSGDDIIIEYAPTFADDKATRITPTLDFDSMNGSARYDRNNGRTYYWGRAGSDDHDPESGGVRVRWRAGNGPWHSCPAVLPVTERGYVHTPAVATTIGGQAVAIQVCLWRDTPYRENCTATL